LHGAVDEFLRASVGFVTLLLFPLLGLLGLLKKRAIPALAITVGIWTVVGAIVLASGVPLGVNRARFRHDWLLGMVLGVAFLFVAWLRTRRKVSRWLKIAMAVITLAVFVRALADFLTDYA
jgi:hypothetical protein